MGQNLRMLETHSSPVLHSVGFVHQGEHRLLWLERQLKQQATVAIKSINIKWMEINYSEGHKLWSVIPPCVCILYLQKVQIETDDMEYVIMYPYENVTFSFH